MPIFNCKLPEYPCTVDVWDKLKAETRPIMIYGMGNGADKLFTQFERLGITPAEIFASDGFVRGHSFRGYKVRSFSEIKAEYSEFIIVLSFASNRPDVVSFFEALDRQYELYIPDMPIAGTEEYFDKTFYNKNYVQICRVYEHLCDDESKNTYAAVLNYKLTGKLEYLLGAFSEKCEMYGLLPVDSVVNIIDAGAYNGDTAREAIEYFPKLKLIHAIEPDTKTFKRLCKFVNQQTTEIKTYNAAVWSFCGDGVFSESGNRNSTALATASHEHKEKKVSFITVDSLRSEKIDLVKYDVEGAEFEALIGSAETIAEDRPALIISLYHRSRDIFFIPEYIAEKYPSYDLYIRRMFSVPAWEINLLAIAKR